MWPLPGQALDRTLAAEAAVEGLYREALSRWSPVAMAAVLPTFAQAVTADASPDITPSSGQPLPPDPAAVEQGHGWSKLAEAVIVAGVGVLFAAAVVEAMEGLGIPLPALALPSFGGKRQDSAGKSQVAPPTGHVPATGDQGKQHHPTGVKGPVAARPAPITAPQAVFPQDNATKPQVTIDPQVLSIVNHAVPDMDAEQLHTAMRIVDETPALSAARDKAIQAQRDIAARTPKVVAEKVTMAVRDAEPTDGTVTLAAQRTAAATVLEPDSDVLAMIAATAGHSAAAVQNQAVMAAAELSEDADVLDKTWICTHDSRTRDTHWAADGARVPLGAPFLVGGEPLMYPADPAGSPAETYGCRCRMGILTKDEALPSEVDRHTERLDGRDSVALHRGGRTQTEEIEARARRGNTRARDNRDGVGTVAAAGWNKETTMTTPTISAEDLPDGASITVGADGETFLTFTDALFAVTGTPTDDNRMLDGAIQLAFRDCPLPVQWQEKTGDGHKGSVTVGVVESIGLNDKGEIRGSGYMLNNDNAMKALDLIQHGVNRPSIDMANATEIPTTVDGTQITPDNFDPTQPMYLTYTAATVTACTIVAIPAFGQTSIALNADRESRDVAMTAAALTAAAAYQPPVYAPAMFAAADPNLIAPMRMTIDPDTGHVFGFIATWKDKHRSVGLGHIKPPRSVSNYEHFHTSPPVHLSDGTLMSVGRLTVGIGHAPTRGVSVAAAQAHYDNVESCWALGRITEHRLGIYFSGVVAPWATPEKVQMGLASPVSGDWRPIGQGNALELVAVLAVNTPGFLCKVETDQSGRPLAMVASMGPATAVEGGVGWSWDDLKAAFAEVLADDRAAVAAAAAPAVEAAVVVESPVLTPNERMSQLIGSGQFTHAGTVVVPVPPSPTDRMAELIAGYTGIVEFGRTVRNAEYWGKPVGTPITPGMKPRGS